MLGGTKSLASVTGSPQQMALILLQQRLLSAPKLQVQGTAAPSFPLDLSYAVNPADHQTFSPCFTLCPLHCSSLLVSFCLTNEHLLPNVSWQRLVGPRAHSSFSNGFQGHGSGICPLSSRSMPNYVGYIHVDYPIYSTEYLIYNQSPCPTKFYLQSSFYFDASFPTLYPHPLWPAILTVLSWPFLNPCCTR